MIHHSKPLLNTFSLWVDVHLPSYILGLQHFGGGGGGGGGEGEVN